MVLEADEIIKAYFKQNNIIIKHQIDSFNYFIEDIIPNILSQFFPIQMNYNSENSVIQKIELHIMDYRIGKPISIENNGCEELMTPHIARVKNSTYMSPLIVNFKAITTINENGQSIILPDKDIENIIIGKVPIMVKSRYCSVKSD